MLLRRIPVSRTKYTLIRDVKTISPGKGFFYPFAAHLENKLLPRFPVVIYRKYWFPIIVSPDNPEEFVREVRQRVYSAELQRSR